MTAKWAQSVVLPEAGDIEMPTYEYRCKHCGHGLEIFQSIKARPRRRCPNCRRNGLERIINGGMGLIFKGSGFYVTDYAGARSDRARDSGKDDAAPQAESSSKSESKGAAGKAED